MVQLNRTLTFLRFHFRRAFKSGLVGAEGALVQLAITYALTEFLGMWYIYSVTFGIIVAFTHNYFLNYYWAFRDVIKKGKSQTC